MRRPLLTAEIMASRNVQASATCDAGLKQRLARLFLEDSMLRDIVNLRIFVTVANCKSFTRAAAMDNQNLTQGAVSIRIKRLEKQIGIRLFDRSRQQLQLTAEGEILLPYVQRILAVYDEARNDIERSKL
jgi:hypothetical protein